MKPLPRLSLTVLLLFAALSSRAQIVLEGDSAYLGLQPRKDSLRSVVAKMGRRYRRKTAYSWSISCLRGGGCIFRTPPYGYTLHYKNSGVVFRFDDENRLLDIRFHGPTSVFARSIRPGRATFSTVIQEYGLPAGASPEGNKFGISRSGVEIPKKGKEARFISLSYGRVRFISWGSYQEGENVLARPVQEIWLR